MNATSLRDDFAQGFSLSRLSPLREQIYRLLRAAIVNGQLKPNQPVDELEIAGRLAISRTPVREAVKKLSDEGLINVVAQSRTSVAPIDRRQLEEAYIIRTALELESVGRAAPVVTKSHVDDLEDILDRLARAFDRRAFESIVSLDDDFHRYIADINGLSMLWRAVDISKAQMDRCSYLSVSSMSDSIGARAIADHKAIIRALKTGRQAAAVRAMRIHLDNSHRTALSLLDSTPESLKERESPNKRQGRHKRKT